MHGHRPECAERFAPHQTTDFARWVAARPRGSRFRVLVDLGEEAYETEVLPRVRGADRRALIARRLAQWFPQPIWARADTLPDKPRQRGAATECVLFSGLTRPERIDPWIDALQSAHARIECTIPVSALLAACDGLADGLLVSFSRAGMRVTLIAEGRARLSRLVEDYPSGAAAQNAEWLLEIARTARYASTVIGGTAQPLVSIIAPEAALPPSLHPRLPLHTDSNCTGSIPYRSASPPRKARTWTALVFCFTGWIRPRPDWAGRPPCLRGACQDRGACLSAPRLPSAWPAWRRRC